MSNSNLHFYVEVVSAAYMEAIPSSASALLNFYVDIRSSSSSSTSSSSSSQSLFSSSSSSSSSSLSSSSSSSSSSLSLSSSSSSLSSSSSSSLSSSTSSSSQSIVIEKAIIHATDRQYLTGIEFAPDGSRFYIPGAYADRIYYWNTNSDWSIDNGGTTFYRDGYIDEEFSANVHTARFADDGNLLFLNGIEYTIVIRKYSLSTPYDITTKNSIQVNNTVWGGGGVITISLDGRYINRGDVIYEMTTPYDLSTLQSPISYSIVGVQCSFMIPNGLRSYGILQADRLTIIRHNFSTAWDANSVTGYDVLFKLNTSYATSLWGIYIKEYSGYVDIYLCEGNYQYTHDMVRCRYYTGSSSSSSSSSTSSN
jgi:hypothetical protein